LYFFVFPGRDSFWPVLNIIFTVPFFLLERLDVKSCFSPLLPVIFPQCLLRVVPRFCPWKDAEIAFFLTSSFFSEGM